MWNPFEAYRQCHKFAALASDTQRQLAETRRELKQAQTMLRITWMLLLLGYGSALLVLIATLWPR